MAEGEAVVEGGEGVGTGVDMETFKVILHFVAERIHFPIPCLYEMYLELNLLFHIDNGGNSNWGRGGNYQGK